jgi:hypothetical protein
MIPDISFVVKHFSCVSFAFFCSCVSFAIFAVFLLQSPDDLPIFPDRRVFSVSAALAPDPSGLLPRVSCGGFARLLPASASLCLSLAVPMAPCLLFFFLSIKM